MNCKTDTAWDKRFNTLLFHIRLHYIRVHDLMSEWACRAGNPILRLLWEQDGAANVKWATYYI